MVLSSFGLVISLVAAGPAYAQPVQDGFTYAPAKVDVLFVMDSSCSMEEEQDLVASAFPALLDWFAGSQQDWHAGVVSMDMASSANHGRLQGAQGYRWVDGTMPDADVVFADMVRLGIAGHWREQGLAALAAAHDLHGQGFNAGFFRPDAQLAAIVISDENDQSPVTVADFVSWMQGLRDAPSDLSFTSLVGLNTVCEGSFLDPGTRYLEVTDAIGGVAASLCQSGLSPALVDAAAGWWTSQPLFLSALPDEATLVVTALEPVGPARVLDADEWGYEPADNSVRTTEAYVPPVGTTLTVDYVAF